MHRNIIILLLLSMLTSAVFAVSETSHPAAKKYKREDGTNSRVFIPSHAFDVTVEDLSGKEVPKILVEVDQILRSIPAVVGTYQRLRLTNHCKYNYSKFDSRDIEYCPIALENCVDDWEYYPGYSTPHNRVNLTEPNCPSPFVNSGSMCSKSYTAVTSCPYGFNRSGSTCYISYTSRLNCPPGYSQSGSDCYLRQPSTRYCPYPYYSNGTGCTHSYSLRDANATCQPGYIKRGLTCISNTGYSYSCPSGYVLSPDRTTCTLTQKATPSCPPGYSQSGLTCTYYYGAQSFCPDGLSLSGSNCLGPTYNASTSCPEGYTKSGSSCSKTYDATPTCPPYYTMNGTTCNLFERATEVELRKSEARTGRVTGYIYDIGTENQGMKIVLENLFNGKSVELNGTIVDEGISRLLNLKGDSYLDTDQNGLATFKAKIDLTTIEDGKADLNISDETIGGTWYFYKYTTIVFNCPHGGTLIGPDNNKSCIDTKPVTYTCPEGGNPSGSKCIDTKSVLYLCSPGDRKLGSTCQVTQPATRICPYGGSLSGYTCIVTEYLGSYNCPIGSQSWTTCSKTTPVTVTCPYGGSPYGTTCQITRSRCPEGFSLSGSICRQPYTYYTYHCKNELNYQGYNWTASDPGGDCRAPNCNSPTPSPNNCRRKLYVCPYERARRCTDVNGPWQCSPLQCVERKCYGAFCNSAEEARAGATNFSICSAMMCDATKPYNPICRKTTGSCPFGYSIQTYNGQTNCYKMECPQNAQLTPDGKCQVLQCPPGSTENSRGQCITN